MTQPEANSKFSILRFILQSSLCFSFLFTVTAGLPKATAGTVQIHTDQLWIDGQAQPQLYGAELQYFRLRGGMERNIPRSQVIALWNQALDRMVEAKMNVISFYIPWDFHEYAEGKFDFTGTADEDGDGNADYPSRDIITFIKMIEQHGIKHIMARPGPFINAEWGFLGFGAIPLWFHKKYSDSHSRNPMGQKTTLFSYIDPDFLRHSEIWLKTVYQQVLKSEIGPGRPVSFIQVDNETNFMWQSIYSHDYGPRATSQYQQFLKTNYKTLSILNAKHNRLWQNWEEIKPPVKYGLNLGEDQDWYRFQDYSLAIYLQKIRSMWTRIGVREPSVLFTLAESYNATENGLLPNYKLRNSKNIGMMTVNLYPKTYETNEKTLFNLPFKTDHDVKAADSASDAYLGKREAWVMGPEIQGGWWKGIHVSEASRQQTYLTTIGHGLKALFVYYFHEGNNWQPHWMKAAITPYFNKLKNSEKYKDVQENELTHIFWGELDSIVANEFLAVDTRNVWKNNGTHGETLYFDAALGPDAQARAPFELLKKIGEKIVGPYGDFLGKAHELEDAVCLVKDSDAHIPTGARNLNSRIVQSDWAGGLLGLLMHSGINPRIHHWNLNPTRDLLDLNKCKLVIHQDTGLTPIELKQTLLKIIDGGGSVLSLIDSDTADTIKVQRPHGICASIPTSPMDVLGYQCRIGTGLLYYVKVPIYDVFNTDFYFLIHDAHARRSVIDRILDETKIIPHVKFKDGGDRAVIFARANPNEDSLWITTKTSNHAGFLSRIQWTRADRKKIYSVTDVLADKTFEMTGVDLSETGFQSELLGSESKAYFVKPLRDRK